MEKDFNFKITGNVIVIDGEPVHDFQGNVVGFKTAQGIVRLTMALELERPDGGFEYLSTEKQMESVGVTLVNYEDADFDEIVKEG